MRTLVEYGLANAAAATLLAVLAFAIGLAVRRPAVRNALWVLVLVRLLMPPVWTITFSVPAPEPAAEVPAVLSAAVEPIPPAPAGEDAQPAGAILAVDVAEASPSPPAAEVPEPPATVERPQPVSAYAIAGAVWLTGTALVLLRSTLRIARFRRALRDAVPAPESIRRQADELAIGMGLRRSPAVRLVPGRVSPALWLPGLFARQATVILPAGLVAVLDARQRAAVLAHELAHLRRGDPWVRWLELVVGAVYWWFPLVGWFRRELRAAEEECCDLRVVAALGGRREYATALVETAAFLGDSGPVPALASGAGPVRHLQRRVTMIMRATWPAGLTRLGLATVIGIGGLGLAFGPAVAQDRNGDPERRGRDVQDRKDPPPRDVERPRDRARDESPVRERGSEEAVERARVAVERARRQAREAMEQLRSAEEALARAEGRPMPPRPENRREPGDRRPDGPTPTPGAPGHSVGPMPPAPPDLPIAPGAPGYPGRPGAGGPPREFRDLQQQIEELRRSLEQMRQELRRDRGERGDRKEPEPRRGRDEPKRPAAGQEQPRA